MILSDLSASEFAERLRAGDLAFRCGPFVVRTASPIGLVAAALRLLYADATLVDGFADFRLDLAPRGLVRRWLRPQVIVTTDGYQPFSPFPLDQAYPLFEWTLNWCIAQAAHRYLIIHAAVVERDGRALIMPGLPGAGKSTLAAALVNRGWRLFSDELTLIDTADNRIVALPRPISLKDRSIEVIRAFAPEAVFNAPTYNTEKGTISHMKVPADHVRRAHETARAGWVVFPSYIAGASALLKPHSRADMVIELARNAFNYAALGCAGFDAVCAVVGASACYDFEYGALDDAVAAFEQLRSKVPA